ncbi:MAG: Amuc_1102 family pilus-like protein [bacterium]
MIRSEFNDWFHFKNHHLPVTNRKPPLPAPLFYGVLAFTLFLFGGILSLHAQINTAFQITKIDLSMPNTPAITSDMPAKSTGMPKKWLEVDVSFNWKSTLNTEKYADDVVVNYYILLANKSIAFPQGTLLTGQVTHTAIPANSQTELRSVMFVAPRTLERFFDGRVPSSKETAIVDIGVTISRQGQVVASKSLKGTGDWWPQYPQTPGYLLNKNETPFAPLCWDYYEPIKKQP